MLAASVQTPPSSRRRALRAASTPLAALHQGFIQVIAGQEDIPRRFLECGLSAMPARRNVRIALLPLLNHNLLHHAGRFGVDVVDLAGEEVLDVVRAAPDLSAEVAADAYHECARRLTLRLAGANHVRVVEDDVESSSGRRAIA